MNNPVIIQPLTQEQPDLLQHISSCKCISAPFPTSLQPRTFYLFHLTNPPSYPNSATASQQNTQTNQPPHPHSSPPSLIRRPILSFPRTLTPIKHAIPRSALPHPFPHLTHKSHLTVSPQHAARISPMCDIVSYASHLIPRRTRYRVKG
jgi:hypothetical protein